MPLKLYNTLTRKKEIFRPLKKGKAGMYVCGPTIYDYVHIGNLRAYVFADTLRRTLKSNNFKVRHVMNLTDIDDKTIKGSQKQGVSLKEFTKKYEKSFLKDINEMNIEKPEIMPHATEHIKEMVNLIDELLKKGYAYKADDGIYFSIKKFGDYGKLSKIKKKELKEGAGRRVLKDEYDKDNVNDFALWKFYTKEDGNVFWNTKIGKGRPGWHIECSAMSSKYLGKQFDIHAGGADLIFPHHENEIAQSEAAFGVEPWVKYWLHNEWVLVDGKKMSKSLGNFYKLKDIKNKFSPLHLRYFFLSGHYRKPLNFTWKNLETAKNAYKRLKNILSGIKNSTQKKNKKNIEAAKKQFLDFLNDDLNIPRALSYMWEILRESRLNDAEKYALVLEFDKVLGLKLDEEEKRKKVTKEDEKMAKEREKARKQKDYKTADKIRKQLIKRGHTVEDTNKGVSLSGSTIILDNKD